MDNGKSDPVELADRAADVADGGAMLAALVNYSARPIIFIGAKKDAQDNTILVTVVNTSVDLSEQELLSIVTQAVQSWFRLQRARQQPVGPHGSEPH